MTVTCGGEALVGSLARHGVDVVFGIPGTHNLPIYARLPGYRITSVVTRHEQGAGYAADGYARMSGRPGVCLTTTGPAALNAAAAVGQAYSDSVPVLLVAPGMPVRHPARGDGYLHETKDQRAAFDAVAALSRRVTSVPEIPYAVAEAFAVMTGGRPRPAYLEVPLDLLAEAAEVQLCGPVAVAPPAPAPGALDDAAARLAAAARPGIIAGGGAREGADAVRGVAERLGAPVISSTNGMGVLPGDHPLALGAGLHRPSVAAWVADCDVVLAVGTELAPSDLWEGPLQVPGSLVRLDVDAGQLLAGAVPDVALHGRAGDVLGELLRRLGPRPDPGAAGTPDWAVRWRERIRAEAREEARPWLWIIDALAAALGRDGTLVADNAMVAYYGALGAFPASTARSFFFPTGFGTLGYALPAAIGALLARPGARVAALAGDGGLMFTVAELATAAQLRLPLPVVVVDNGGYGEIRREMRDRGDPVHSVDLDGPDFTALARGLGCHAAYATGGEQLRAAVARALSADRPTLVHVPEDPAPAAVT